MSQYKQAEMKDFDALRTSTSASTERKIEVAEMNPAEARFPLCITWTPLPLISWFLPMIGHTGICGADGIIYDFAGPYYISKDDFAFGETHKYVVLDI